MAYREMRAVDIDQVMRRWLAGEGIRSIHRAGDRFRSKHGAADRAFGGESRRPARDTLAG